ncbi:MAG: hypothetical protein R3C05_13470 [Pirellulaceae bacterium]
MTSTINVLIAATIVATSASDVHGLPHVSAPTKRVVASPQSSTQLSAFSGNSDTLWS